MTSAPSDKDGFGSRGDALERSAGAAVRAEGFRAAVADIAAGKANRTGAKERGLFPEDQALRTAWDHGYDAAICAHRLGHDVAAMAAASLFVESLQAPEVVIQQLLDGAWGLDLRNDPCLEPDLPPPLRHAFRPVEVDKGADFVKATLGHDTAYVAVVGEGELAVRSATARAVRELADKLTARVPNLPITRTWDDYRFNVQIGEEQQAVTMRISLWDGLWVLLFPDGRQLTLSRWEWIAIGVLAMGDGGDQNPTVAAFRARLVGELARPMLDAVRSFEGSLANLVQGRDTQARDTARDPFLEFARAAAPAVAKIALAGRRPPRALLELLVGAISVAPANHVPPSVIQEAEAAAEGGLERYTDLELWGIVQRVADAEGVHPFLKAACDLRHYSVAPEEP